MKRILIHTLALFAAMTLHAQDLDLPVIPDDPSVVISTLPCGIHFYYVPNPSSKNMLSMALVQIPDSTLRAEQVSDLARKAIKKAAFHNLTFEKFLASNGILPQKSGYFTSRHDIIFRFDSLSLVRGETVLDSTLYGVFRIAGESAANGIPPSSQAFIAVGDISYKTLSNKVEMLSMACPKIAGESHRQKYRWKEPSPGTWKIREESGRVSKIVAEWTDARIPEKYMKTVLPTVGAKLSNEFGWVLKGRLYPEFRKQRVPVWMDYSFTGSADSQEDELSRLVVYCAKTNAQRAMKILETELDRLMTYGVEQEEYCYCRDAYKYSVIRQEMNPIKSNDKEIRKCISHFLCGASLASGVDMMKFEFRQMPDSMQTRLFNNYLRERLSVGCKVDSSLSRAPVLVSRDSVHKVLSAYIPQFPVKLPKDRNEYCSDGRKWSFSSGPVVVHRKMQPGGLVWYCYAVKGGSQWADPDYLNCIDGVSAGTLSRFLAAVGADMNVRITPACVYFSGSVPGENLETLVNTLAAISRQAENDQVFSTDRYKLFITAGPMDYEEVKEVLARYAGAFGAGTDVAVGVDLSDMPQTMENAPDLPPNAISTEFQLTLSSGNYALSRVARLVLRDRIAVALSDCEATARIRYGFESFPEEKYRIVVIPSKASCSDAVVAALKRLAADPLEKSSVDMYVKMAMDEFQVYKSTPQYYLDAVARRYIDFKDLYTDFDTQAKKISATDLKEFFAAALDNVK